jgi:hypothetical protein
MLARAHLVKKLTSMQIFKFFQFPMTFWIIGWFLQLLKRLTPLGSALCALAVNTRTLLVVRLVSAAPPTQPLCRRALLLSNVVVKLVMRDNEFRDSSPQLPSLR